MKQILLSLCVLISLSAQQAQVENYFDNLPTELKYNVACGNIIPLIKPANGILNLPALANELQNLSRTNKKMHAIINNPQFMLAILKSLPKAAVVYLASGLRNMPGIKSKEVQEWLKTIKLVSGLELYKAANYNDEKKVHEILKDPNSDVNWDNKCGWSPLLMAAYKGNIEIVKLLLAAGVNVNAPGLDENTALIWAYPEIVKLLLTAGADPKIHNKFNESASDIARREGHIEIAKILDEAMKARQAKRK